MSRADDLRAQFEADIKIADLEDELVRLKEARSTDPAAEDDPELRRVKDELLEARVAAWEASEATTPAEAPAEGNGG